MVKAGPEPCGRRFDAARDLEHCDRPGRIQQLKTGNARTPIMVFSPMS
jgi:hypothetical protein